MWLVNKVGLVILSLVFFATGCTSFQGRTSDGNVDINISTKYEVSTKKSQQFIELKNLKTGKAWKITYEEFIDMANSYEYWTQVSNKKPEISEIKEDDEYLYITFNYYDSRYKDKIGFKINKKDFSILSGKILVPKRYLQIPDKRAKDIMIGVTAGVSAYAIAISILLIILL
jgi:hypothetical protein